MRITRTLAVLLATTALAHAADDAVCRPYATALLNAQMTWLWNRAYSHCSLLEEEHPIPPGPGDWQAALSILDPAATPIMPLDRDDVANIGNVPASDANPSAPAVAPSGAQQQSVCTKFHMRTMYLANGRSWRCAK